MRPIGRGEIIGLWVLLGVSYAAALVPAGVPGVLGLLLGWVPVAFAFWHFARWAGTATALLSFVVIVAVSFTAEAIGVATGLVFGEYYYADGPLGPLVLGVPPLILLQYFAMGYASLFVARSIAGMLGGGRGATAIALSALMSAFAITVLDLATDPWQSTHLGYWVWPDGGSYFGVPVHNFVGWFAEALVFFAIVAALLARPAAVEHLARPRPAAFDLQGVLLYGTFPFAILVRPFVVGSSEIADALAGVAAFAVLPVLLAGLLALRSRVGRAAAIG